MYFYKEVLFFLFFPLKILDNVTLKQNLRVFKEGNSFGVIELLPLNLKKKNKMLTFEKLMAQNNFYITEAFYLEVEKGRMYGAPNETRIHL